MNIYLGSPCCGPRRIYSPKVLVILRQNMTGKLLIGTLRIVSTNLISCMSIVIHLMFVLYIFSFHRGCARELDHSDSNFGGFGDQCQAFFVAVRVCITQKASPFCRTSSSSPYRNRQSASSTPFVPESPRRLPSVDDLQVVNLLNFSL